MKRQVLSLLQIVERMKRLREIGLVGSPEWKDLKVMFIQQCEKSNTYEYMDVIFE